MLIKSQLALKGEISLPVRFTSRFVRGEKQKEQKNSMSYKSTYFPSGINKIKKRNITAEQIAIPASSFSVPVWPSLNRSEAGTKHGIALARLSPTSASGKTTAVRLSCTDPS